MNRNEAKEKLLAVMKQNYHKNDHVCLKTFINDVDYFVIEKLIKEITEWKNAKAEMTDYAEKLETALEDCGVDLDEILES